MTASQCRQGGPGDALPTLGNRNYKNECVRRGRQETCMSEINEGAVRQYGWSAGGLARLLFVVGVTFSAFQIVTASFSPLSSSIVRGACGLLAVPGLRLFRGSVDRPLRSAFSWLLAVTGFVLAFYHWIYEGELIQRAGDPTTTDLFVGGITVLLVFEATRRVIGFALPLICSLFLAYALFGEYLPGDLAHRGYALSQVIDQLGFGTEGHLRHPDLCVVELHLPVHPVRHLPRAGRHDPPVHRRRARYRGPYPRRAGQGGGGVVGPDGYHQRFGRGQRGHHRAVLIPLMKNSATARVCGRGRGHQLDGWPDHAAGDGAVAFIMAETIGVPYLDICLAAAIPAALFSSLPSGWCISRPAVRA